MGKIPVKNQSGVTQFFGHTKILPNETADLPYDLAKYLALSEEYRVESKDLIPDFPFADGKGLHLGWSSPLHYADGYGSIAQEIASTFLDNGIRLSITPRDYSPSDPRFGNLKLDEWTDKAFVPENIVSCLKQPPEIPFYGINMTWPKEVHRHKYPRGFGFTMFETTHPPKEWSKCLNMCRRILVPCQQNKEAFQIQGCISPIHVVPLGVNPTKWPISERKDHKGPFTFLMAAGITMRKNPIDCVTAFIAAFPRGEEVRLILKTRGLQTSAGFRDWMRYLPYDPRVEVICEESTPAQMVKWMHDADCFVFPSHSEGFGLTGVQSMCTGLPLIISDNSGMSEYCDSRYNYPVECYETKVPDCSHGGFPEEWGDVGNWWTPHFDALVEAYRGVYNDPDKAYRKGLKSAGWVRKEWTVHRTCERIIKVICEDAKEDGIL